MLEPRINNAYRRTLMKTCHICGINKMIDNFIPTNYWGYPDGAYVICNDCIKEHLQECEFSWDEINILCQTLNIPFVPKEFERLHDINGDDAFPVYVKEFQEAQYERLQWREYNEAYTQLKQKDLIARELPKLRESYFEDLGLKWGQNYDEEDLIYLENLYNGLLASQHIEGALQADQAQKLCKMSLQINERIIAGLDFDKLMSSYEKLSKIANIVPSNAKMDNDLSSVGEIVAWLEKRGWINKWYDGGNHDILDEVIHSMQAYVQRLYIDEPGIGEEITERIQALKIAAELDEKDSELDKYHLDEDITFEFDEIDLDARDNAAYEGYMNDAIESPAFGV